jgi:prevent-host-death family protein
MESLCLPQPSRGKNTAVVVSALSTRSNFGKLLRRVDDERRSLVIEKRGPPRAVLLSIRDYVKLAAPEPEVLRVIGAESERNGTSTLTSRQIEGIIKATRSQKLKRSCFPPPFGDRYERFDFCRHESSWAAADSSTVRRHQPACLCVSRPVLEQYELVLAGLDCGFGRVGGSNCRNSSRTVAIP